VIETGEIWSHVDLGDLLARGGVFAGIRDDRHLSRRLARAADGDVQLTGNGTGSEFAARLPAG